MGRRRSNIRWRLARRRSGSPWAAFGARLLARRRLARRHQRVQASVEESGETLYEEIANAVVSGVAAVLSAAGKLERVEEAVKLAIELREGGQTSRGTVREIKGKFHPAEHHEPLPEQVWAECNLGFRHRVAKEA